MPRNIGFLVFGFVAVLLSGCSTFSYSSQPYSSSMQNSLGLKELRKEGAATMAVGMFRGVNAGENEITCRATGPILPTGAPTFGEYVRMAVINELQLADLYDSGSRRSLTVDFTEFDFDSIDGEWMIHGNVTISEGGSYPVTVSHRYGRGMGVVVDAVCTQTAQALNSAVQEFVNRIIMHPEFRKAVRQ